MRERGDLRTCSSLLSRNARTSSYTRFQAPHLGSAQDGLEPSEDDWLEWLVGETGGHTTIETPAGGRMTEQD